MRGTGMLVEFPAGRGQGNVLRGSGNNDPPPDSDGLRKQGRPGLAVANGPVAAGSADHVQLLRRGAWSGSDGSGQSCPCRRQEE